MRWLNERLARARSESGVTLIELVVVCSVMTVILGFVTRTLVVMQNAATGSSLRLQNLDEARILMATTTKDLRTATRLQADLSPFVVANKREVKFYANLDTTSAPQLIRLYVDSNNQLIENATKADNGSQPPLYSYTGNPKVRFVGRYVANPTSTPLFRYYDANGNELTNVPLSNADGLAVTSVSVTYMIRKQNASNVPYTTLVNTVYLPNVFFNPIPTP